jgi:hypothetical protein
MLAYARELAVDDRWFSEEHDFHRWSPAGDLREVRGDHDVRAIDRPPAPREARESRPVFDAPA